MHNVEEILYEYAVVRYVPRIDREEFINIGLIMMCKRHKWLKGEILIDERRLKIFHPATDLVWLERQASLFCRKDVPAPDLPVEERYRWLSAVKSAILQISPSHPGLISTKGEDPGVMLEAEFRRLFHLIVS